MKKILNKTQGFFAEFSAFAVKGNALGLAVAVVVGGAFSGIVNALVADIITPLLGLLTGNVDLKTLSWTINSTLVLQYGAFLQSIFNFLVISLSIFIIFKVVTTAHGRIFKPEVKPVPEPVKPRQEVLLEEIRDLLKERK